MEKLLATKKLAPRWYERFPRGVPVGIFVMTMAVALLSVFAIDELAPRSVGLVRRSRGLLSLPARAAREVVLTVASEQLAVRPGYYQPDNVDAIVMRLTVPTPTIELA